MNQQVRVRRMVEWLTFTPSLDKVARALVLDYFLAHAPIESTIWHLNAQDELTCLAVYGPSEVIVGVYAPGSIWRSSSEFATIDRQSRATSHSSWLPEKLQAIVNLYSQGALIGFLTLRFDRHIEDPERLIQEIEHFSTLIALYISLRFLESMNHNGSSYRQKSELLANSIGNLTERQRAVLAGIALKKTNNVIAGELGYSVSTIRHDTMRIFEVLGVSNRIEAANYATSLGLV